MTSFDDVKKAFFGQVKKTKQKAVSSTPVFSVRTCKKDQFSIYFNFSMNQLIKKPSKMSPRFEKKVLVFNITLRFKQNAKLACLKKHYRLEKRKVRIDHVFQSSFIQRPPKTKQKKQTEVERQCW